MERCGAAWTPSVGACYLSLLLCRQARQWMRELMMPFPADDGLPPIHPGEILGDDLEAMDLSAGQFAAHIGVPPNTVTEILKGECAVTASMALRFGKAFGTDPRYWTNLQSLYEIKKAQAEIGDALAAISPLPTRSFKRMLSDMAESGVWDIESDDEPPTPPQIS
jgi:addiction module HigA family antidote